MLGVVVLALLTWGLNQGGFSGGGRDGDSDPGTLPAVALTSLPPEARQTVALIDAGGPFPYDQDGTVFENHERLLPSESSGYYHEYTVTTPGSTDRGARRIITGSGSEMYWTDDHYQSFERIVR
jgi:ribonuclease T1